MSAYMISREGIDLIRLIGAFVMFASVLMFFHAASVMLESWTNIKMVNNCLQVAGGDTEFFAKCNDTAVNALGISIRPDQSELNGKQLYSALAPPISNLFFWIAILLCGVLLYNFRKCCVPIKTVMPRRTSAKKKK